MAFKHSNCIVVFNKDSISCKDIQLYRMMDITYYHLNFVLELYVGVLQEEVELVEEVNPLEWLSIEENFADPDRFAGKQNIAHIINVAMEFEAPKSRWRGHY